MQYGINCLKRVNYDKKELEGRREKTAEENTGIYFNLINHMVSAEFGRLIS